MSEVNKPKRIRELVDTIESSLVAIRAETKRKRESRTIHISDDVEYMQSLVQAVEELITLVGYKNVPPSLPELASSLKRTGYHDIIETHDQNRPDAYVGAGQWIPRREEPAIFKELARMRYQLPEMLRKTEENKHAAYLSARQLLVAESQVAQAVPVDDLVTLNQAAAISRLSKRTLERYRTDGKLPDPDYPGGGGKAHRWYWRNIRPDLAKCCNVQLPEKFPGSRII